MEALRNYLKDMTKLESVMLVRLGEICDKENIDFNKTDEMREAVARAQAAAVQDLKERQAPYYAVTYPQLLYKCPSCREELKGAYWEISNPVTNARGVFRVRLMHEFLAHGESHYIEPIINMSDTKLGDDDHKLDAKKLAKILQGLALPPEAAAELESAAAAAAGK